jgi:hypothetical protein
LTDVFECIGRKNIIAVKEKKIFALGFFNSVVSCRRNARVILISRENKRIFLCVTVNNLGGAVG